MRNVWFWEFHVLWNTTFYVCFCVYGLHELQFILTVQISFRLDFLNTTPKQIEIFWRKDSTMLILAISGWDYLVPYIMFEFLVMYHFYSQKKKVTLISFREVKFLLELIWYGITKNLSDLLFSFVVLYGLLFCDWTEKGIKLVSPCKL